jgi:hypothetical protein
MNRKKGDKKLEQKNLDRLRDSFRDVDDEQLEQLKKKSPWFTPDLLSDREIEEIKYELAQQLGKPLNMGDVIQRFGEDDEEADDYDDLDLDTKERRKETREERGRFHLYRDLDICLLYTQFKRCKNGANVKHKIELGSEDNKLLYGWSKFRDITEPFICSIQYMITEMSSGNVAFSVTKKKSLDLSSSLQNWIAESALKTDTLVTTRIIEPLETVLDVYLMRLVLYKEMLFLIFEWQEPMLFAFVMAFSVNFTDPEINKWLDSTVFILYRKDIMEYQEENVPVSSSSNKKKKNDVSILMNTETSETKKTKFISSEDILGKEPVEIGTIKAALQTAHISYISSGYIKRD